MRVRMAMKGPGKGGRGTYAPPALEGWKQYAPGVAYGEGEANPWPKDFDGRWKWVDLGSGRKGGKVVWIAEEELRRGEEVLLERWPDERAVVESKA